MARFVLICESNNGYVCKAVIHRAQNTGMAPTIQVYIGHAKQIIVFFKIITDSLSKGKIVERVYLGLSEVLDKGNIYI